MIIGIHQPNYLPYLGFFDKMFKSDIFVIYDDAQFSSSDFHHRNRLRIFNGWKWLTVPVDKKRMQIKDIKIRKEYDKKNRLWTQVHYESIISNYHKAKYCRTYIDEIESIYQENYDQLIDLNMDLIYLLMKKFNIKCEIIFSSELDLKSQSTMKLVEIMQCLDGDTYLSGIGGSDYLDLNLFEDNGIDVVFQQFNHPVYSQVYEGFFPNMSAIDYLLNCGNSYF